MTLLWLWLNQGVKPIGIFCDLSRDFNCVSHEIFTNKLNLYWIREESSLHYLPIDIGFPQGSALGPLLLLPYINDIFLFINAFLFTYADSTALITGKMLWKLKRMKIKYQIYVIALLLINCLLITRKHIIQGDPF